MGRTRKTDKEKVRSLLRDRGLKNGLVLFIGEKMGNRRDEREIKDELRIVEDCAFKPR